MQEKQSIVINEEEIPSRIFTICSPEKQVKGNISTIFRRLYAELLIL